MRHNISYLNFNILHTKSVDINNFSLCLIALLKKHADMCSIS